MLLLPLFCVPGTFPMQLSSSSASCQTEQVVGRRNLPIPTPASPHHQLWALSCLSMGAGIASLPPTVRPILHSHPPKSVTNGSCSRRRCPCRSHSGDSPRFFSLYSSAHRCGLGSLTGPHDARRELSTQVSHRLSHRT